MNTKYGGKHDNHPILHLTLPLLALLLFLLAPVASAANETTEGTRQRIIVSTDIGGTDFDDFQSMVHLFAYADRFDIEGLISSPYGPGRKSHILQVIDAYEHDYPNLRSYSEKYPRPDALREISKQGALDSAGLQGFGKPTEGSEWIVSCARRTDPRPLWVLVWGGIDDVAQALHDDPAIKSKLRVYFIGGPNKKWSATAYDYIARNHPDLWVIEANDTYRGWFVGGDQAGDKGNTSFVTTHVAGHGAMGDFFAGLSFDGKSRATIKMGDTPSLAFLLGKNPGDPSKESWGGKFVRAWERRRYVFDHAESAPPNAANKIEVFSILDLIYHPANLATRKGATASLLMDKQEFPGFLDEGGAWHFILSPKDGKTFNYSIKCSDPSLDGKVGSFTANWLTKDLTSTPSSRYPNWWTDDPDPAVAEHYFAGAKTVNKWRTEFLTDFAERMRRCQTPSPTHPR